MSENPKFVLQNPNPIQDPKSEIQNPNALGQNNDWFWKGVSRENKDIKITTTSTTTAATNKNKKKKNNNNTKQIRMRIQKHKYRLVPGSIAGFAQHNNIKVPLEVGRLQHSKTTILRHPGASSSWTLTHLLYHPCLVLILGSKLQLPQTSKQFWLHLKVYVLSSPNHFRMSCATLLHDLASKDYTDIADYFPTTYAKYVGSIKHYLHHGLWNSTLWNHAQSESYKSKVLDPAILFLSIMKPQPPPGAQKHCCFWMFLDGLIICFPS